MGDGVFIGDLDKREVLRALFTRAQPQGMGFVNYDPSKALTDEECEGLLGKTMYFDYLQGRVMKVDLEGDNIDPWLYDRDNGAGACADAIERLRGNDIDGLKDQHDAAARQQAREAIGEPDERAVQGETRTGIPVVTIDDLHPAAKEAARKFLEEES